MAFLRKFWESWKRFGHWMGDQVARIVLTLFYFTIFLPFGLVIRVFGDPLAIKNKPENPWLRKGPGDSNLDEARRLF
jgi:hypothetical protein